MRLPVVFSMLLVAITVAACAPPPRVVLYEERHGRTDGPKPDTYEVRKEDNLYRIAQRFGLSTRALIDRNNLRPPYDLYVGQALVLPTPRIHQVTRGDTVYGISRRYGVAMSQLVQANGLKPPYTIHVGQSLRLPGAVETRVAARVAKVARKPSATPNVRASKPKIPSPAAKPTPRRASTPRPAIKRLAPVPKASPAGYVWPVEGRIISAFGGKGKGLHNDGINVSATRGTPVVAAQNGIVAYAGNELRGFGNLVLIKHSGDVMTAYAHNDSIMVQAGQNVTRGQQVARVGSSGSVDSPQLHFEIRFGREAVDPIKFLGKRSALLDGGIRTTADQGGRSGPG